MQGGANKKQPTNKHLSTCIFYQKHVQKTRYQSGF